MRVGTCKLQSSSQNLGLGRFIDGFAFRTYFVINQDSIFGSKLKESKFFCELISSGMKDLSLIKSGRKLIWNTRKLAQTLSWLSGKKNTPWRPTLSLPIWIVYEDSSLWGSCEDFHGIQTVHLGNLKIPTLHLTTTTNMATFIKKSRNFHVQRTLKVEFFLGDFFGLYFKYF